MGQEDVPLIDEDGGEAGELASHLGQHVVQQVTVYAAPHVLLSDVLDSQDVPDLPRSEGRWPACENISSMDKDFPLFLISSAKLYMYLTGLDTSRQVHCIQDPLFNV